MKVFETKLPAGEIVAITKLDDGTWVVKQKVAEEVVAEPKTKTVSKTMLSDDDIILIEAEGLSLNDQFMLYEPDTEKEKCTKDLIAEAIKAGVKNFYRPKCDPSFTDDGICFVAGKAPAVGKSYNWWFDTAKKYDPSRNSRLGTRLQYGAFLGVLIKKLVEEGMTVAWAWNAVCNNSKELGHYYNSEDAKQQTFELTGSRCICGFYDLVNTFKLLAEVDEEVGGFWIAGGYFGNYSYTCPLADLEHDTDCYSDDNLSVGWLVFS